MKLWHAVLPALALATGCASKPEPRPPKDTFAGDWTLWTPYSSQPGKAAFKGTKTHWAYPTDTGRVMTVNALYFQEEDGDLSLNRVATNGIVGADTRYKVEAVGPALIYLTTTTAQGKEVFALAKGFAKVDRDRISYKPAPALPKPYRSPEPSPVYEPEDDRPASQVQPPTSWTQPVIDDRGPTQVPVAQQAPSQPTQQPIKVEPPKPPPVQSVPPHEGPPTP